MKFIKYFITGLKYLPLIIGKITYFFLLGIIVTITIFPKYFIIGIYFIINPKKSKDIKVKNKPIIPIIMMSLALSIYLLSVFIFSSLSVQKLRTKYLSEDIQNTTAILEEKKIPENIEDNTLDNEEPPTTNTTEDNPYYPNDYWDYQNSSYLSVDFNELKNKNSDTVAWLKLNNTYINYPITQTNNNGYYLNHDFSRQPNAGGWVYGDYRSNFTNFGYNTIIYGHNLINKTMFGSLTKVLDSNWYTNGSNQIIKMSTPTSNTLWQIFSVYTFKSESYYLTTDFNSSYEYSTFLNTLKGRSIHDFGVYLDPSDKILTLSTCDDTGTKRVVVHAKMVSIYYR